MQYYNLFLVFTTFFKKKEGESYASPKFKQDLVACLYIKKESTQQVHAELFPNMASLVCSVAMTSSGYM
jgi:hypothetical protein